MFILKKIRNIIKSDPKYLGQPIEQVLAKEINRQVANKVVLNVGLVICLHDIVEIGESFIFCGDGSIHTRCVYRIIVFRPQIGEILVGSLRSSSKEGLIISLVFFDSIVIPPHQLNEPSNFNEVDQTWTWNYEDDGQTHVLRLEIGEQVRFRVHSEQFVDVSPHGPPDSTATSPNVPAISKSEPYTIVGSICESGLGLVKWWR